MGIYLPNRNTNEVKTEATVTADPIARLDEIAKEILELRNARNFEAMEELYIERKQLLDHVWH